MKLPSWMHRTPHDAVTPPPAPSCRLIVVEDGAQVVDAISGGDWEETVVIAEQEPHDPLGLVEQVIGKLRLLEREYKRLQTAELVVSSCRSGAASATRRLVARALLSRLTAGGGGELIVVADGADSEGRDALLELVSQLLGEPQSKLVTIRVQFRRDSTPAAPTSGVRFQRPEPPAGALAAASSFEEIA